MPANPAKTERSKTFPPFSNKHHTKQDDMGGHGVAISCCKMISVFVHSSCSDNCEFIDNKITVMDTFQSINSQL